MLAEDVASVEEVSKSSSDSRESVTERQSTQQMMLGLLIALLSSKEVCLLRSIS